MKHSLYKKESIRKLWYLGISILGLTVIAEFFIHLHAHFENTAWFSFYAVFGFFSCVALVLFAKLLGFLLKRKEDYYG